ncbi:MAG: hypothetical protein R3B48_03835 [Kofleriaceae bacterium]
MHPAGGAREDHSSAAARRGACGVAAALALAAAACGQDVDPPWQLDHDRVIAVRATPPRIATGEIAELDVLLGRAGAPPAEVDAEEVEVTSPSRLASALVRRGARWTVVAPDEAGLAAARAELGLAATEPVPLQLRLTFTAPALVARKTVWLGPRAQNPTLDPITIDGASALELTELSVGIAVDVPVAVDLDDRYNINWLTSCGTMHDFDLARAYLRVEPEDHKEGTFALVVRDELGGVAWKTWAISAR